MDNKYVHDLGEWVEHGREQALPYRKLTKEFNHVYPIICLLCNYKLPSYPETNRIKDKGINKIFRVYKVRLTGCPVIMNFVKDGETLVRAKADICRGKSLVVNKYHEKVYIHFFGSKAKHICLDEREFANVKALNEEVKRVLFELKVEVRSNLICFLFSL